MKQIVVSGYYGFGNVGDEAVLLGIKAAFEELGVDAELTVLSADPQRTMREHPGVRAVPRGKLLPVIGALRGADLFLSGGGSLFQDATSARSPYYYLWVLRLAQILRRKTMIYAQGVGPLIRPGIRKAIARAFSRADAITVRDADSKGLLQEIEVSQEIQLVADPAFLVEPDLSAADRIIADAGLAGKGIIGISLRPWPGYQDWLRDAARTIEQVCRELGAQAVYIPMRESEDKEIALDAPVLSHGGDPRIAKGLIARCELAVGMRLHSLIFAAACGVPFVPIEYDPKIAAFASECGIAGAQCITVGSPVEVLADAFRQAWRERESLARQLTNRAPELREQALLPARIATKLL